VTGSPIRLVAIVGPTASGKSALALRLAEAVGGEIVSADSQQVYRGMDIGTAKATGAERERVPHHLIDVMGPDETMTAARFATLAEEAIRDITARSRQVIVCGGTGLYYRSLVYGLFAGPPADASLRLRLEREAQEGGGPEHLWGRLQAVDPEAASRIDLRDLIRIVRALEVYELTQKPISEHQRGHDHKTLAPRYDVRGVGLDPPRPGLYQTIDARVRAMFDAGLVDEVRSLRERGYPCSLRAFQAIGYREVCAHLSGGVSEDETVRLIQQRSRRYARRQLTWFRTEPTVTWYKSPADVNLGELAAFLRAESEAPRS
jgi:tRNA dimethylallyltransferase